MFSKLYTSYAEYVGRMKPVMSVQEKPNWLTVNT